MQSWQSLKVMAYTAGWQHSLSSTGPRREVHTSFKSLSCWHTVTDSKVNLPRTMANNWRLMNVRIALFPSTKRVSPEQVIHGLWSVLHGEKQFFFQKIKAQVTPFEKYKWEPWTQQVWFGFGFILVVDALGRMKDPTWGHARVKQSFSLPLSSIIFFLRVT